MGWRAVECEHCGLRYREFRADDQPTFAEAYWQIRAERDERIARENDYSGRPRRRKVLWRMHEWKLTYWNMHVEQCRMEAEWASRPEEIEP